MEKSKKVVSVIKSVAVWAVVAVAAFMMIFTVVSVNIFDRNDRSLFGYKAFIVLTDSMSATDFSAGDLIFSKKVDPSTLQPGDIISFQSMNNDSFGKILTHKIRSITTDQNGAPAFVTYGTTTGTDDESVVTYEYVLGKYSGRLPGVGKFFQFLKTTPGYITCVLLPFMLLIIIQGLNSVRLFRRYKQEQLSELEARREQEKAELAAERERLEAERLQSQQLMEELQKLKQELADKKDNMDPPDSSAL